MAWLDGLGQGSVREGGAVRPCGCQLPDGGKSLQRCDSHMSHQLGCSKAKSFPQACTCADTPRSPSQRPIPISHM